MKIDAEAMRKYAKAFSKEEAAKRLIAEKEQDADESILKLARRKRAIVATTIKDFLEMYEKIQKVSFSEGDGLKELQTLSISSVSVDNLHQMTVSCSLPLTDKELILGVLFAGMMMVRESERNLSAASSQVRASNVAYSQAETISVVYDAVKNRADRMADLLKRMNAVLFNCNNETKQRISKYGYDVRTWQKDDRVVLVNCINWVKAIKDILDVPLFNKNGELEQQAEIAITIGEEHLAKINNAL